MKEKVVVLGGGKSGISAACLAAQKGYQVLLSDAQLLNPQQQKSLQQFGVEYEQGGHTEACLKAQLIIKSPGIARTANIVQQALNENIEIISEVEFGARYTNAHLVGITGTNGKTTTTLLTAHLINQSGASATAAGNVGVPLCDLVLNNKVPQVVVLELSSFQLDDIVNLQLTSASVLNITPDHLDRYNFDFQAYVQSKFKIAQLLQQGKNFVFGSDCPSVAKNVKSISPLVNKLSFGLFEESNTAYATSTSLIFEPINGLEPIQISIDDFALQGNHNLRNALAAGLLALPFVKNITAFKSAFSSFVAVPHRLQPIATQGGVAYINDSKATNVDSAQLAIGSYADGSVVWLAGGLDKGNNYTDMAKLVARKVKAIVAVTQYPEKLQQLAQGLNLPFVAVANFADALSWANAFLVPGTQVLLSPACASFDLFENYEHRGDQFAQAVKLFLNQNQQQKQLS